MSKKNKNLEKQVLVSQTEEKDGDDAVKQSSESVVPAKEEKKAVKEDKNAKNKKEKKPKEKKFRRKVRETVSELKKVSWPSFGEVCKKTGIVLSVVVIFGIVLFGLDVGLYYLFGLLT